MRRLLLFAFSLLSLSLFAQQTITGVVRSGGTPVQGATVTVKGSKTASQTNKDGVFSISAPAGATLAISHVSFTTKEVAVAGRTSVDVDLEPLNANLADVVVVGY